MSGKMPRSPLSSMVFNDLDEVEDAVIVEDSASSVREGRTERIPPVQTAQAEALVNPTVTTVDISAKKMQRKALREMNESGGSLADLFDGDVSLQEQMGIAETITRMSVPCMCCALPRKKIEDLEQDLFQHQIGHKEVADKYDLTVSDITQHIQECVIGRQTVIPAGQLVNKLVFEINEFIARMDSFRLELDSSMSPESISTYLSVLSELRVAVKDIISLKSPDDEAIHVVKRVFNPLTVGMVRGFAKELDTFRKQAEQYIIATSRGEFKERTLEFSRSFASSTASRMLEGIRTYCEMNGVKPEVVLGDSAGGGNRLDD